MFNVNFLCECSKSKRCWELTHSHSLGNMIYEYGNRIFNLFYWPRCVHLDVFEQTLSAWHSNNWAFLLLRRHRCHCLLLVLYCSSNSNTSMAQGTSINQTVHCNRFVLTLSNVHHVVYYFILNRANEVDNT